MSQDTSSSELIRSISSGNDLRQVGLYISFGVIALALELSVFFVTLTIFAIPLLISNFLAISSGMLLSFTLNASINFKVNDKLMTRFSRYSLVVLLGYIISSSLILLLISFGSAPFAAKLMALPVVFLAQFTLNKRFTFSQ